MNARWIGRILRGVRAGERHCALNHAALFVAPEVISLKSEWFLNGKEMPLRCAEIRVGENISASLSWSGVPAGTLELAIIIEDPERSSWMRSLADSRSSTASIQSSPPQSLFRTSYRGIAIVLSLS
jgi:hypothetical protein